jgi:hypothetical protein
MTPEMVSYQTYLIMKAGPAKLLGWGRTKLLNYVLRITQLVWNTENFGES